jgi:hypothetical protein
VSEPALTLAPTIMMHRFKQLWTWYKTVQANALSPMPKQRPQRCNARTRRKVLARDDQGRLIHFQYVPALCQRWPVRGKKRCRLHGGRSTGPITPDGLARTLAGMRAGRTRWLARLKSEGKPIPCGRKKGGRNLPAEERAQVAYEKQCRRQAREVLRQIRAERKARRVSEEKELRRKIYLEVAGVRRRGYRLPIHRDDQTTFQMIHLGVKQSGQDRSWIRCLGAAPVRSWPPWLKSNPLRT